MILVSAMANDVELKLDEQGSGRPVLVLHGGGGPVTDRRACGASGAERACAGADASGLERHDRGRSGSAALDDLAMLYLRLLKGRGLRDVTVVGSSMGGWIALGDGGARSRRI